MPKPGFFEFLTIFYNTKNATSLTAKSGQPPSKPWRPFYLRRAVISCFVFAACGIISALEVLNHISKARNGLASSVQNLHYIWTYTPTAALTIISALWARTEFQAKQNAPWRSLQKPEQAERSLLLDYDNIPPVALWKSFKYRHLHVAAGISCSLILQLAILFSTSLFSLQGVDIRRFNVPVQLLDIFNATDPNFNDANLNPFDVLNGIQFGNMSYPDGTNADVTFQRFNAPQAPQGSLITAPIRAMEADLECEQATLKIDGWAFRKDNNTMGGVTAIYGNNTIATPSCTIFNTTLDNDHLGGYPHYYARIRSITCDNSTTEDRQRMLIFAIQYHEGKILKNNTNRIPTFWSREWELVVDNSVQLLCKPRFNFVNMQATANSSDSEGSPSLKRLGIEDAEFPNLNAKNISQLIMQNADNDDDAGGTSGSARPIGSNPTFVNEGNPQTPDSIDYNIQLGAYIAGKTGDAQKIFQDGVLEESARAFYRSMAAQIIHNALVKPKVTQTSGSVVFNENRVLVMQSPLRILEACMAILALVAIAMVLLGPSTGSPLQSPSNILTIANVLRNSQILRRSLHQTGASNSEALGEIIRGSKYFSQKHPQAISIEVESDKQFPETHGEFTSQTLLENPTNQKSSFWKPFPNLWSRIPVFCIIGGAIAALEALLRTSQKNNGLGDAIEDGRTHYLWTALPSLGMLLISLFIGSVDSNTRALAPYSNLQKDGGVGFEALGRNYIDALRLTNLFRSARTRDLTIVSTSLAALIASFLTIVTSGLFSAIEVPQTINANFTRQTVFVSPDVVIAQQDTPDFSTVNYILSENLTYPKWTYQDLVFPELSLDKHSYQSAGGSLYADVRVPAIRGYSDCDFETGDALNYSITHSTGYPTFSTRGVGTEYFPKKDMFNVSLVAPRLGCPIPSWPKSRLTETPGQNQILFFLVDGYFAIMDLVYCLTSNKADLPTLTTYTWGYFENDTMQHISSMSCVGKTEAVDTVTRFQLPGFDIPVDHPPVPDESSVKELPHMNGTWSTYLVNTLEYNTSEQSSEASFNIDNFFTVLLEGRYKIPKEYLRSPKYNSQVQQAIKHQDGIFRAQPLRNHARLAANGTLDGKPLMGSLTLSSNLRIFQDEASTRVLEVMLGLVLLFSILGSVLMNTDHVLPKNPGSIAAVGSLLADSNILSFCSFTEQIENSELLRRCRVHLGWLSDESPLSSSADSDESTSKDNLYFTIYVKDGCSDVEKKSDIVQTKSCSVKPYNEVVEGGYI